MTPIKVLVVDDSVFMRQAISKIISCDQIRVIDTAKNGREGVDKVIALNPDVVTMDIEMPEMTGLDALKEIMNTHPVPVIMVSTLTSEGANATIEALSNGAVDFITKKSAFREMDSIKDELVNKIKTIGFNNSLKRLLIRNRFIKNKSVINQLNGEPATVTSPLILKKKKPRPKPGAIKLVSIGISTGGPNSLNELIRSLPENFRTPVLIAQHMPAFFTKSLAERLNSITNITIKEAEQDEQILPATIYIAQGGKHLSAKKNFRLQISEQPPNLLYKPSVDVLMDSVADVYGSHVLGIIMTGMGHDGTEGIRTLQSAGGYAIAQDPDSCVISGMPKSIIDAGLADEIVTLSNLGKTISEICRQN